MKRTLFLCSGLLSLTVCTNALPPKNNAVVMRCPLTTFRVNIGGSTKAKLYADYKGNRYYFCCNPCPKKFWLNPEKYVYSSHIPIP